MFFFQERKEYNADLMRRGNRFTTDKAYKARIETISSKFEYIAGGIEDDYIYLRCKDCGYIFKYSKVGIRPSHRSLIICRQCQSILASKQEREAKEKRRLEQERKIVLKLIALRQQEEARHHICLRCGKEFIASSNRKYCSKLCGRRASDSIKEHTRRIRINAHIRDNIQLPVLYQRDKGICWICEKVCDWNDCEIKDGAFITHADYPTIDHFVPLAKGGTHTWNNVRLACFYCNSYKGANIVKE